MRDLNLPPAPPLAILPEEAAPTRQARPTDKDGGPLDALSTCRWCGGMHPTACPFIKVAEWHSTGQLARVVLKERPELEKAILYPFEQEVDTLEALRRGLLEIAEMELGDVRARKLARSMLGLIAEETT